MHFYIPNLFRFFAEVEDFPLDAFAAAGGAPVLEIAKLSYENRSEAGEPKNAVS